MSTPVREVADISEAPNDFGNGKVHLLFVDDDNGNRSNFKIGVIRNLKDMAERVQVTIFHFSDDLRDHLLAQDDVSNVVLVTDNDMEPMISGTRLARDVLEKFPQLPVAIWTGRSQDVIDDPNLPKGLPVFDKVAINNLFSEFVRPQIQDILSRPTPPGGAAPSVKTAFDLKS